jgi:hypothetical protein
VDFDPEDKLIPMHRGGNITLPAAFVEQFDITGEGRLYHELSADGKTITLRAANIEPLPPEPPLNQPPNAELLALSGVHRDDNH